MAGTKNMGPFLVIGATGTQGGAVAKHLLAAGANVLALTRSTTSDRAQKLARKGVTLVTGDMDDPESLRQAFKGAEGVFSVQDFYAPGVGKSGEIRQGLNVLEAAGNAGVKHLVQSVMGDAPDKGSPDHFQSKAAIEQAIRASDLNWTLLGTVWFMDNLLNPKMAPKLTFPILSGSLEPDTKFPMLAVDDLGAIAAEALMNPGKFRRCKLNLANDSLTSDEMKAAYRRITGKSHRNWRMPAWIFRRLAKEFAEQLAWHNQVNFSFGSEELLRLRPKAPDFASFIQLNKIEGL